MNLPNPPRSTSAGFTLIELLIVVAIIAILAAIAVPNFLEAQTRAKVSRVKSDLRSNATALESYFIDNNKYPPTPFVGTAFDNGVLRVIPNLLSTPISYISTAGASDVFIDVTISDFQGIRRDGVIATYGPDALYPRDPGGDPLAGQRYYFQNNKDDRRSPATQLALQAGWPFEGLWIMASLGPNRRRDFPVLANSLTPYDPTNGTISDGDIVRSQKSPEGRLE